MPINIGVIVNIISSKTYRHFLSVFLYVHITRRVSMDVRFLYVTGISFIISTKFSKFTFSQLNILIHVTVDGY